MAAKRARRRTKEEVAAAKRAVDEAKVVQWADAYGAPVKLLVGWDPDTGQWAVASPVGLMLGMIQNEGLHISVAAKIAGVYNVQGLIAKGIDYMEDMPEDRAYVKVEVRPFIDLVTRLDVVESWAERTIVKSVFKEAQNDAKIGMQYLGRRFGQRWREQQAIFTADEVDERDKAVSEALADPNTALALAQVAHTIEDTVPQDT